MGRQLVLDGILERAGSYSYILIGEEHFFPPHQQFARKLAENFDTTVGVELVPSSYSRRSQYQKAKFIRLLDKSSPSLPGEYQCLAGRIVGLRSCPGSQKAPTLKEEFETIRQYWHGDDEGYSHMLADQIKKSKTRIHLLGSNRVHDVSYFLPGCLQILQLFSPNGEQCLSLVT